MSRVLNRHEIILPEFELGFSAKLSRLWPVITPMAGRTGIRPVSWSPRQPNGGDRAAEGGLPSDEPVLLPRQNGEDMENTVLVYEWDSDAFHRRVIELESAGYTSRQESYHISADVNPETGEIVHLHTIEMLKNDNASLEG